MLHCPYASTCSGCELIELPEFQQKELKINDLKSHWQAATGTVLAEVNYLGLGEGGLRDRADFQIAIQNGRSHFGLFNRERKNILDLEVCPQLSPALLVWFEEFRKIPLPINRGSVRLRVASAGQRGAWLDLANLDVKRLLEERTTLDQLRAICTVEIGQKRKRLVERDGNLKLADAIFEPWFETYVENQPVPLFCTIGSFTQPGFRANRELVRAVMTLVEKIKSPRLLEFGSGIGNFTLPIAATGLEVHAFEVDQLAIAAMAHSLQQVGLRSRVQLHTGNFQLSQTLPVKPMHSDLVLVDPPRSGLMKFIVPVAQLEPSARPKDWIYVSCFSESFSRDGQRLMSLGYRLRSLTIIDQFPQSRHYEIVAHFSLGLV